MPVHLNILFSISPVSHPIVDRMNDFTGMLSDGAFLYGSCFGGVCGKQLCPVLEPFCPLPRFVAQFFPHDLLTIIRFTI